MHVFLLDIPALTFAAIIPKGDYATLCMLGPRASTRISWCGPSSARRRSSAACRPTGTLRGEGSPVSASRVCTSIPPAGPTATGSVFIGDCGVSRLNKDGIGAAYRAAQGGRLYGRFPRGLGPGFLRGRAADRVPPHRGPTNAIGRVIFKATPAVVQKGRLRPARGIWSKMAGSVRSQQLAAGARRMSQVLWDIFTGSAPYREILTRTLHPAFLIRFAAALATATFKRPQPSGIATAFAESSASGGDLGEG